MIKVFNAFQIVVLFACLPFVIGWLWGGEDGGPFPYSIAVFWLAVVVYAALFFAIVGSVVTAIEEWR